MSGISGIINLKGAGVDSALLSQMGDMMAHRGPDGIYSATAGEAGMACVMLRSTPESLYEKQPLSDASGRFLLVLDGRVDNREELTAALQAKGYVGRDNTDAELVLNCYRCWGSDAPERMLGEFAFAVWDKDERRLFCARDPLGVKPLYYYQDDATFAFCSELEPFFCVPGVPRRPNLALIGLYLLDKFNIQDQCLYEGVRQLPPGYQLTLSGRTLARKCYWAPDPEKEIRYKQQSEYDDHFRELLTRSLQGALRSSTPVGVMLSGGLDSSSLVSLAYKLASRNGSRPKVRAFSITYPGYPCDESDYIRSVVEKWNVDSTLIPYNEVLEWVTPDKAALAPDAFYQPLRWAETAVFSRMRDEGIKVVMDGVGGDELFTAGFEHLTDLARQARFVYLARQLKYCQEDFGVSLFWLVANYCIAPFVPRWVRAPLRPVKARLRRVPDTSSLVPTEFARTHALQDLARERLPVPKFQTQAQQILYSGVLTGWNATVAFPLDDLFIGRFSLDRRRPYLSRPLIEFTIALPQEQRWRAPWTKYVMRQAMTGILPEPIRQRRTKTIYRQPLDWQFRAVLAPRLRDMAQNSALARLHAVDPATLRSTVESYLGGDDRWILFMLTWVGLEIWLRQAFPELLEPVKARRELTESANIRPKLVEAGEMQSTT